MAKKGKIALEILLESIEISSLPMRRLLRSRNLLSVDLIWPRTGVARKSAARQVVFRKGKTDFTSEEWAKRLVFREEIEGHAALAVSVSESVTQQKLRRFARLTAKYALRMGADFMEKAMVGYADIASSPLDALSQMVGEKDAPKSIVQGVVDINSLPNAGEEMRMEIPLKNSDHDEDVGVLRVIIRA